MARVRRAASAALVLLVMLATVALGAAPVGRPARVAVVPPRILGAVAWPPSSSLLVAEVVTGAASATDEYVELTNASAATIDLGGLELVYVTASGSTITRKAAWSSPFPLEPGRHLLVANASGAFAGLADATYSGGFAATGGALAVRPIGGTATDAMGWGDATNAFVEGTVAPAPPAGSSLERRPGGSAGNVVDTNDNAADFAILGSPVAQSLASPPVPSPAPSPTPATSPTPTTTPGPTATPSPSPTTTPSPSPSPTPTPSSTPSPTPTPTAAPTPTSTPIPTPTSTPTATPTPSPTPTPTATLVIGIAAARAMPNGAAATIEGVVTVGLGTLESGRAGFVQDASGGIAIYLDAAATSVIPAGTHVRMTGSLDDRYAQRTLRVAIVDLVDLGPAMVPDPVGVPTGTAAESIEGVRVVVFGTVTEAPTAFADGLGLLVDDGSGPLRAIVGPLAQGLLDPHRGDLVRVVGPIGQRDSSGDGTAGYRLHAMNQGELELVATPSPTPSATATPTATVVPPSPTPSSSPSPTLVPTPSAGPTPTSTPTAPTPTPVAPSIASVRGMPIGSSVSVEGTVTAEPGRLGSAPLLAVGDESGGIFVRLLDGVIRPARGDRLVVTGKLTDPYGQLEIRTTVGGIVPADRPAGLPAPLVIESADLGEMTEGRLATLTGSVEHAPAKSGDGLALWVLDDAGDRARVLLAGPSRIVASDLLAGHRYRLTGIVGQRASRKGAQDGYRLWLRDRSDIVHLASPAPTSSPTPAPSSGPDSPSSVSIARALALQGRSVSVAGVVTVPASLLDASGRRIVIQDGSAAIEVLLPTGARSPGPGHRLRVVGQVGRAYDAPRIRAKTVSDLGAAAMLVPRSLSGAPTLSVEWRLVRIVGTVVDVRKLGERWRAEVRVGTSRVVVSGLPGARIVSTALVEGRRATIAGIVRRAYPGAADRRFAVVPRSPADIALSGSGSAGAPGTTTGGGTRSPAPSRDPRDRGVGADGAGSPLAAAVELSQLGEHVGQRIRVGGLVVDLAGDGFTLDDGSATGRIVLTGEAAAFLGLIEPGDAVELAGMVEMDADGGARLVVEAPADLLRVGALGGSPAAARSSPEPAATGSTSTGTGGSSGSIARAAGLGGLPDPTVAGAGWLALVVALSVTVTLIRRRRARRGLSARIAARLAALSGPPPVP